MSARLEVRLQKRLPGFALDVEWSAGDGVAVLFGPSGAGKSLTLQCLAGLLRPDAGRVVVDGRVLFDSAAGVNTPPQKRHVGYVFQGYALFPHLSVADNVGFGLRGRPRSERQRRVDEVLGSSGIEELGQRQPAELSGGQRQRVALGRALATDPALLLLDEPLSALDLPLRRALRDELRAILADWGTAAVVVTHDFTEAYRLGDRIVVYEEGRVIQAAPSRRAPVAARLAGGRPRDGANQYPAGHRPEGHAGTDPVPLEGPDPGSGELALALLPSGARQHARLLRPARICPPDPERPRARRVAHHMNVMHGHIVREADFGTTWSLYIRLDEPGEPAQGDYDLEVEVPRLVYEILEIDRDRQWEFSIHRGSIHVLPST